jgi:N-acetylneuraminate synthase
MRFEPSRCLIVGEVGQAHDGSLGTAHALIDVIADCGADAVKFQTHIAAAESTPSEPWRVRFSPQDVSRYDYWARMEFTEPQWRGLRDHSHDRGICFVSSPFSREAVDLLERIGVDAWKVASGEIGNHAFVEQIRATQKPLILSSGLSDWSEIDTVVEGLLASNTELAVLQCTTNYPCPPERWGLNVMAEMINRYECPIGFSDHSGDVYAGLAAATLGAQVLEVHVTLSKRAFGPDVSSSLTPEQLASLVTGVRAISTARNSPVDKNSLARELEPVRALFSRSLVATRDLAAGTTLSEEDLMAKKPGTGIPADQLTTVIGRSLRIDVARDDLLTWDALSE